MKKNKFEENAEGKRKFLEQLGEGIIALVVVTRRIPRMGTEMEEREKRENKNDFEHPVLKSCEEKEKSG